MKPEQGTTVTVRDRRRATPPEEDGRGSVGEETRALVHAESDAGGGRVRTTATLLQRSPVALESEADIFVLPALVSPPSQEEEEVVEEGKKQTLLPSARHYSGGREGRRQGRRRGWCSA